MGYPEIRQPFQVAIVGGGFCGTLAAVNLMQHCRYPLHVHVINKGNPLAKGVAYAPNNPNLLLNVPNGRMSAFADVPDHFTKWLKSNTLGLCTGDVELAKAFSTRWQYGNYLAHLWQEALLNKPDDISVTEYEEYADDLLEDSDPLRICLRSGKRITADMVILATGNEVPLSPSSIPSWLKQSDFYFADPWKRECIEKIDPDKDILIIGNGLSMVDAVTGLLDNGLKGSIHTVSPHGYRLMPSVGAGDPYIAFDFPIGEECTLLDLVSAYNKHRKRARHLNQSILPAIDSLRPYLQRLWLSFSLTEKQQFMHRIRPFWEIVRHRLPKKVHHIMNELQFKGKVITHKGEMVNVAALDGILHVSLKCDTCLEHLKIQRIINCTGPATDITQTKNVLLQNLLKKGIICPAPFGLGIQAHQEDGSVIDVHNERRANIFIVGSNLKGALWESTAIPELRVQAKKLAVHIASEIKSLDDNSKTGLPLDALNKPELLSEPGLLN